MIYNLQNNQRVEGPYIDEGEDSNESLDIEKKARNKFITKVYTILAIQLSVLTLFVYFATSSQEFRNFQITNIGLWYLIFFFTIICLIVLGCFQKARQKPPYNFALLTAFTLADSYLISTICQFYTPESVLLAAGVTASVSIGLTSYAMYTKNDFTTKLESVTAIGWSLIVCSIFSIAFGIRQSSPIVNIVLAILFGLLFSAYLVIDTQLIMGDKKRNISLDDYISGAIFLYLDIVGLFLEILRILGKRRN